jgi:phosphate-selective porin OprO/OprP
MSKARWSARCCAWSVAAVAVAAVPARGQDSDETEKLRRAATEERIKALEDKLAAPDMFRVQWKDGLRLTTPDNMFDIKIGGRLHFEGQWNDADDALEATRRYNANSGDATAANTRAIGPLEDAYEVRRARLYLSGLLYQHVEFKWQYDFAKGAVADKDVYAGLVNLGDWVPNFRAGHMYEQFGLDALTSSNDSVFIERAAISNVLAPNRNPGVQLWKGWKDSNNEERMTWAVGCYREDNGDSGGNKSGTTFDSSGDGAYNVTARVTGTPYWTDSGKRMVHVGAAATRRGLAGRGNETLTIAGKPEVDTFPNFVSTGAMGEVDSEWRYGAEIASIWSRWTFAGEYMWTKTNLHAPRPPVAGFPTLDDASFSGWYAQASYMLTGETRRWKPAEAIFQNPRPYANAFQNGAMGAWEVALRYSTLDLTDGHKATGGVEGGELQMITAGLNWYLNPNTRLMFDVSRIDLDEVDPALGKGGDVLVAQFRVQVNF